MAVLSSEFSEFAFGFSVTHQLVNCRIGALSPWPAESHWWWRRVLYPFWDSEFVEDVLIEDFGLSLNQAQTVTSTMGAPFIPTQLLEKGFPVDMAMNANGLYYFLQFKRSTCVSANHGGLKERDEIAANHFDTPLYRVKFGGGKIGASGKNGDREQRDNLERRENSLASVNSAIVRYVAPAFHELSELAELQNNGLLSLINGRWPVVSFRASSFTLPDNKRHWVSFDGKTNTGWRYSSEPEKVPDVSPLVDEIEKHALDAPPLSRSMGTLCEKLDNLATEMGLEPRPEKPSDREFLSMFGISPPIEEESISTRTLSFLARHPITAGKESQLADAFRKILSAGDDEKAESRMTFLNDFYGADYRCRQILGQPLMVGAQPGPNDLDW